ncbi:MAG: hypothetical protein MK066_07710 [Crocinitomicaceae bacterium]|nr:hypothetical protein [Crocinitomicaceae bacterium]
MKILKALCFSLLATGGVYAQDVDNRLLERYSKSELETMKENDREEYNLLIYAIDNGIYVIDNPTQKEVSFPVITVADIENIPSFLELDIEIKDQNQYFKISGSDKLLVVKSTWVLNHEMTKK